MQENETRFDPASVDARAHDTVRRRRTSDPRRLPAWSVLPYVRLELPGWGRLLRIVQVLGPRAHERWRGAPTVRLRGKNHGYVMTLDLENWSERLTFFLGRYYDLPSQLALRALLRPGDRMADVGANIGMISLLAARLVGESGRVDAFEPNPWCVRRLEASLSENGIAHVRVHPFGLSDRTEEAVLTVSGSHSGSGTLSDVRNDAAKSYGVEVRRGDDVLCADPAPPMVVKIDVEGLEVRVLRGLQETLEHARPAVLVETIPAHLERAGSSVEELCGLMRGCGYRGYELRAPRAGLGFRLALPPLGEDGPRQATDTLWLHPASPAWRRLEDRLL